MKIKNLPTGINLKGLKIDTGRRVGFYFREAGEKVILTEKPNFEGPQHLVNPHRIKEWEVLPQSLAIVSNFRDYYDNPAPTENDPIKSFNRTIQKLDMDRPGMPAIRRQLLIDPVMRLKVFLGEIWFCDNYYPYIKDVEEGQCYYNLAEVPEELAKAIRLTAEEQGLPATLLPYHLKPKSIPETRLNSRFHSPVLYSIINEDDIIEVVANGQLRDLSFFKVKPAELAYLELYAWIPVTLNINKAYARAIAS